MVPRLEKLHARLAHRKGVRHTIVGAASLDGGWEWVAASGEAHPDGAPMTAGTPFFLASVTKLYIAAVVLRLVEQGRLELRGSIRDYLPGELCERLHVLDGVDHTDALTPEHLLGHLSGLPDYLDDPGPGGKSLVDEVLEYGDREWDIHDMVHRIRTDMKPYFVPSPLDAAKPKLRYSDTNFRMLVAIVEHVTGTDMTEAYRTHLYAPLGLTNTWLPGDPTSSQAPPASVWLGDRLIDDRPRAMRSFGDLSATMDDVLAFGRGLFTGALFDDPTTASRMWARPHSLGFPRGAAALRAPSWPIQYGLGAMYYELGRLMAGGRRIPALVGHTGSTGSWLWFCPELGLLLAGTVDQSRGATVPFRLVPQAVTGL
jgi:CubicO group peptidase (beta-lactamase class C family)